MVPELVKEAARLIAAEGGRLLLVGGRVRDGLLGLKADTGLSFADYDLVAFNLSPENLSRLLARAGPVRHLARRTFSASEKVPALFHLRQGGNILEISLPKTLQETEGREYSGGALAGDALARDFTINAIYQDPLTGEISDPLDGRGDLAGGRLRLCSPLSFDQDPLRLLRAMSFISRLGFAPSADLLDKAREAKPYLSNIPPDRFWPEWRKWASGSFPRLGLEFLADSSLRGLWPVLENLAATPQNPRYHKEGDVWIHTLMVVEELGKMSLPPERDRVILTLAALLHDVGKPSTTREKAGKWISHGHARAGVVLARIFLRSLRAPGRIIEQVGRLVGCHMDLYRPTPKSVRRLARRLGGELSVRDLYYLVLSDDRGRIAEKTRSAEALPPLEKIMEPLECERPPEYIKGRDILSAFPHLQPGPEIGRLLKLVNRASDDGLVSGREEALALVAAEISV